MKLLVLLVILGVLGAVYAMRRPLLRAMGEFWVVDESPQASDAILILDGDNYSAERAGRAAELYHAGWAPRLVASGHYLRRYATNADLTQHDLIERGVPAGAIVRFPQHAMNTREEARALRQLVQERGWRRLLVVTSNYHTRRARYIFRRVLPADTVCRVVAARDSTYDPSGWWRSRLGVKILFLEAVGLPVAVWELRDSDTEPAPAPARSFGTPLHP